MVSWMDIIDIINLDEMLLISSPFQTGIISIKPDCRRQVLRTKDYGLRAKPAFLQGSSRKKVILLLTSHFSLLTSYFLLLPHPLFKSSE